MIFPRISLCHHNNLGSQHLPQVFRLRRSTTGTHSVTLETDKDFEIRLCRHEFTHTMAQIGSVGTHGLSIDGPKMRDVAGPLQSLHGIHQRGIVFLKENAFQLLDDICPHVQWCVLVRHATKIREGQTPAWIDPVLVPVSIDSHRSGRVEDMIGSNCRFDFGTPCHGGVIGEVHDEDYGAIRGWSLLNPLQQHITPHLPRRVSTNVSQPDEVGIIWTCHPQKGRLSDAVLL